MALGRSITWMGVSQIASVVFQFAASVVLARLLTPYDMGIYAVAAATVGLVSIIQAFGLQSLIVREEQLNEEIIRTAFTLNLLIALLLSAAVAVLSFVGGSFLGDAGVSRVMLALSISPLFGIFDFLPSARLERAGRFDVLSKASIASGLLSATATIVFALSGARYMSAAYAGWIGAASYALMLSVWGREYVKFGFGFGQWRRVGDFGLQMFATAGLHNIGGRLSDICLGHIQGLAALGIYSRASNLNGLLWNNINLAVGRVMFVEFAELHRQGISLRERYIATVEIITAVLWPAFIGFAVLARPIISAVYGKDWVEAAEPLALIALSSVILVSITMTWEVFSATGNLRTQTRIEFYFAIFNTGLFAIGSAFGLLAAAASRSISAIFAVMLYRPHLNKMTQTSVTDFLPIYARSALLTLLAVGPAAALMVMNHMSADVPLIKVFGSIATGITLWVAGLFLMRHRLVAEMRSRLQARSSRSNPAPSIMEARDVRSLRPAESRSKV